MVREITREQWDAMSAEQVASWMRWAMERGAEAPLSEHPSGCRSAGQARFTADPLPLSGAVAPQVCTHSGSGS